MHIVFQTLLFTDALEAKLTVCHSSKRENVRQITVCPSSDNENKNKTKQKQTYLRLFFSHHGIAAMLSSAGPFTTMV